MQLFFILSVRVALRFYPWRLLCLVSTLQVSGLLGHRPSSVRPISSLSSLLSAPRAGKRPGEPLARSRSRLSLCPALLAYHLPPSTSPHAGPGAPATAGPARASAAYQWSWHLRLWGTVLLSGNGVACWLR